jgi:hypothetical protein
MAGNIALMKRIQEFNFDAMGFIVPQIIVEGLDAALVEFNLAPDANVDVLRTPASVTSFDTYIAFLRQIKEELSDPTEATKTSGRMRYYKLGVCCLHALHGYGVSRDYDWSAMSIQQVVDQAMVHGRTNKPPGLSTSGALLWDRTFDGALARPSAMMKLIVFFICEVNAGAPPDDNEPGEPYAAVDPVLGEAAGQVAAALGEP